MFPVLRIVEGFRLKKELRETRVEIKILEIRRVRDHLRQLITDTAGDLFRRKDPQDQDERDFIAFLRSNKNFRATVFMSPFFRQELFLKFLVLTKR